MHVYTLLNLFLGERGNTEGIRNFSFLRRKFYARQHLDQKNMAGQVPGRSGAVCNKLPPPAIMFIYLFVIVAVISAILSFMGVSAVNPSTDEVVAIQNPISSAGLIWLLENMLNAGAGTNRYVLSPEYERAILKELFLRRTRQLQTAPDIGQR